MGCTSSDISYDEVFKGSKRGVMRLSASHEEDFMTHHLSNEASLSQYASTDAIRKRQIIQHFLIDEANGRFQIKASEASVNGTCLTKSWMQRLFLQFLEQMDEDYFKNGKSYDASRQKLADRYLFQLYQLKEFAHAGASRIKLQQLKKALLTLDFSFFATKSDDSLYAVLKMTKQKYPQVADSSKKDFPDVKEIKKDADLLSHFESKCFVELFQNNYTTITHDLKYLFDTAFNLFEDFKTDMKDILGQDVLADVKVKCTDSDNGRTYNASSTRRVLIKWAQTLLQRIPQSIFTMSYLNFIGSKKKIMDNFHVKSTQQTQTTHNIIIQVLLKLIDDLKYDSDTNGKQEKFGFFIYDLLRCKTHRQDGKGVIQLIQKMKSTKVTKTGKKLQVMRIKNRFKTPNRDVMVNFKYGDIIVAQAQLGIDSSDVSDKDKKTNKMNHYLYQLERGLFGPTIQLMMQYEDFNRKDVIVDLKSKHIITPRLFLNKDQQVIKKSTRKCPNGHELVKLYYNFFMYLKSMTPQQNKILGYMCDFCLVQDQAYDQGYDYCPKCGVIFCLQQNCMAQYKKCDPKNMIYNICKGLPEFKTKQEFFNAVKAKGSFTALFTAQNSSISKLTIDYLAYINCILVNRTGVGFKIANINATSGWGQEFAKQLDVTRFPTFVAFDRNCKPRKRIIGASLFCLDIFDDYVTLLKDPNVKRLPQMNCNVHPTKILQQVNVQNVQNWKCRLCNNSSDIDSIASFFKEVGKAMDNNVAYACPQSHGDQSNYVCRHCAFLLNQDDSLAYMDVLGKSYLSCKVRKPSKKQCANGHILQYVFKNPSENIKLQCSDCNKNFFFSKEDGVGYCKTCNYIADPRCMGMNILELDKDRKDRQIVSHFAEMTASQVMPCPHCFNIYTKQYTPKFPYKKPVDPNQDQDQREIQQFFDSFNDDLQWQCVSCKKLFKENKLHLACNTCGQQCCINCAQSLFNTQESMKEVSTSPVHMKCPSGHEIVKTTEEPDLDTLKFECSGCHSSFTINYPNYWCKTCNIRYCDICGISELRGNAFGCLLGHNLNQVLNLKQYRQCSLNPNHIILQIQGFSSVYACDICKFYSCNTNRCVQRIKVCKNDHYLRIKLGVTTMSHFCDGCGKYIDPISYECIQCSYDLCFECYKK